MDEQRCRGRTVGSLTEVIATLEVSRSARMIVGIDGRSGAGKTMLADELALAMPDTRLLRLDDVFRGWEGLGPGLAHVMTHAVAPLARGSAGRYQRWNWEEDHLGTWEEVPALRPGEVLLVEGCGAIAVPLDRYIDVAIWCHAPTPVRRRRAMERDHGRWEERWEQWARQEEALIRRRAADLCWVAQDGVGSMPSPVARMSTTITTESVPTD